jgi:hypothetical protein
MKLTEDQLEAVARCERPLHPMQRIAFKAALERALAERGDSIGDGALYQLLRSLQREVFRYPDATSSRARHG